MEITKDILLKYYIEDNHTFKECLTHFNLTNHGFYKLLHEFNLEKPTAKAFKKNFSKDVVAQYYILEDHTFEETIRHFGTTSDILRLVCKDYELDKRSVLLESSSNNKEYLENLIDKSTLYDLYIKQNKSQKYLKDLLKISLSELIYLLNAYKIKRLDDYKFARRSKSEYKDLISKELFKLEYIDNNLSVHDFAEKYKVPNNAILFLAKEYNLFKPKLLQWILAKESKLKNSGQLGNPNFYENYSAEFKELYYNKELSEKFLDKSPRYNAYELAKRFNCKPINVFGWAKRLGLRHLIADMTSHYESEICDFIKEIDSNIIIEKRARKIIPSKRELDIYLPDYKLAIEFNGTHWHSDKVVSDKKYHLSKSIECENLGIRLIHIYEYEWLDNSKQDLIKTLIKLYLNAIDKKIYARNCEIKQISNKEAKPFNEANHLLGHRNAQVTYGLFYKGELVQLMSFSKTKWNRNLKGDNDWEIIRGCPGSVNLIIGGVSKLFKHFIREYDPDSVFSYCDFNKFNGISYEKIGMKFVGYTGPDKKYIIDGKVFNRNPSKYQEFKNTAQACIYGAGSKKYFWSKNII